MDLKIDPEALKQIVQQALLDKLTPEMRADLIKQAIAQMLQPEKTGYGKQESPFEKALQQAAYSICIEVAKEELAKPETRALFSAIVSKALAKALDEGNTDLVTNMAHLITQIIKPARD
jgi:hypothetical protein